MKLRLADYVAEFLVARGVSDVFSVVGGGAMHFNDAFGHHQAMRVTYHHHEQACAMAAEAYARLENKVAAICVTTGPGGINAMTGVAGAWLDSIPMVVISGQVRYDTTARYAMQHNGGLPLRAVGDQEFDVTKAAASMTKYAAMLEDPTQIRCMLEKAWHLAITGRKGPVWLDIPVNYQGMMIDPDVLPSYDPSVDDARLPPPVGADVLDAIVTKVKAAKRPVIYAGGGVRLSGGFAAFRTLIEQLNVPIVTYWNSIDLIEDAHPLYVGRGGNMGERAGNFAVQNADLLLVIGSRISIRQTGYSFDTWAREAEVIMVDIDPAEMTKHTIHVDMPVWADAKDFMQRLSARLQSEALPLFCEKSWLDICQGWKHHYPVTLPRHWDNEAQQDVNVYAFVRHLSEQLPQGSLTAVSNGACCVVGHQNYCIQKDARFIINNAIASMGYGLPAAIGVCVAANGQETICLEGDGSIMMNLQELQTIVTNQLPIKVFIINNGGYHSIRITQRNLFGRHSKVGIGAESQDLGFPSFAKIARAFEMPYYSAHTNDEMKVAVAEVLSHPGFAICEIYTDTDQVWEPKSATKRLEDGSLVSPPLEDLAPFLPREELAQNMFIPMLEE